jgi:TolB-like protein/class 3 adenylate cyclase/rhodanese-related sulfurtransferase
MAKDRLSGKLAVILHADVAGSTELVQQDEQLAHERIQDAFRRFSATIEKYQGGILELRGDALLAQFERASDAVAATLAFQADHTYLISRLKDDLQPTIRVGIAMGEVVIADNTVTGSGVVLAQRVEQLADPGGLCITAALHEALPKRMPFDLENMGEQVLKGFDDPVRVYRVELSADQSVPAPQQDNQPEVTPRTPKLIATIIVIALVIVGGTVYFKTQGPQEEPASAERMAYPMPENPSIAVLPFTNLSDDTQQEYFADGMTEDLITDISKVKDLFVIARNSVFTYKGKAVKVRQVAEELGVRYVMEGSVRRVGNQVRINAQLIDATTGGHLWAERYDGSLDDVFAMQDKIIKNIVTALAVTLVDQEQDKWVRVETTNAEAYDAYLRGWEHYRQSTPENFKQAVTYFEQAIKLDPDYARAHSALAAVYWNIIANGWWHKSLGLTATQVIERTRLYLKKAMEQPSALSHQVASERAAYFLGNPDRALAEAERAIALDANDPAGHLAMANALLKAGNPNKAISTMHHAMRLDPHFPASYLTRLGRAQFERGQYQEAATTLERAIERNPQDDRAYAFLIAAYGHLGLEERANSAILNTNIIRARTGWDDLTLNSIDSWKWAGDREKLREGMAKAGVKKNYDWYALVKRTGDIIDVEGATRVNAEKAKQLYDRGAQFIDVFRAHVIEHVPGAHKLIWSRRTHSIAVPRDFSERRLLEIANKTQETVIYSSGSDSYAALASAYAVNSGFQKIYYFQGGIDAWKMAGFPVEAGK